MHSRSWRTIAAVISASVLLAIPAAGITTAAPRPFFVSYRTGCEKSFDVGMIKRAIRVDFAGNRDPSRSQRETLWRFWRCSRYPKSKAYELVFWRHQLSDNWKRRHPPVVKPESSLVECIMYRESTDNPEAVNGDHEGLGQWDEDAWYAGDGERFAPTPLGATYSEQVQVLNDMLPQQLWRWQEWDGC